MANHPTGNGPGRLVLDRKQRGRPDCAVVGCIRTATVVEVHLIMNSVRHAVDVPFCDICKEQS